MPQDAASVPRAPESARFLDDVEEHQRAQVELLRPRCREVAQRLPADESLREVDRRKDEFLAILAHELRNPLAPIKSAARLLQQPGVDDATVACSGEVIERQVEHLTRLVDDLLDISRIRRGTIEIHKEPLVLGEVVTQAVEISTPLIEARRHALGVELPADPLRVAGDRLRLAQVLTNLLNNAAKFTEPGGRIDLKVVRAHDQVAIRVQDSGIGIAPALLPRVFDLFVQADHSWDRSKGGLGVGLTLAQRIVTLHGGTIAVTSAGTGQGCEVCIHLPLLGEPPPAAAAAPARDPARSASCHRVLVADDNVDAADSLALVLQLMGHEARTAHDGREAVEVAAAFEPELILLDIGMPVLNGYDACRLIREHPSGRTAVIVALTGWGQDQHKDASRAAGFDRHLVKPIEPTVLTQLLADLNGPAGATTAG